MSVENDSDFLKVFVWVLESLVVFTFFIIFMANIFSPNSASDQDPLCLLYTSPSPRDS